MSENTPRNVIHLSTAHIGGAGIAARRLNRELNFISINSVFVANHNENYFPTGSERAVKRDLCQRFLGGLLAKFQSYFLEETYFTFGSISALRLKDFISYSPKDTVIHVHNWFNLADLKLFRKLLDRGFHLVFTLHDMRFITGACHYSLDCDRFKTGCNACPKLPKLLQILPPKNLENMRTLTSQYESQIEIIVPSMWLKRVAENSAIISDPKIHFVPNIHVQQGTIPQNLREIPRPNREVINIGIASLNVNSPLKGGDVLVKLISEVGKREEKIEFVFLSDFDSEGHSQEYFWESVDYLMVISRADNSPNVIHEAKQRHVPIIATNVGGISELLNVEIDTLININELTPVELIEKISRLKESLGNFRPRKLDTYYLEYMHNALELTVNIYKKALAQPE